MSYWNLYGGYREKTDVHVDVRPADVVPTVNIAGTAFIAGLGAKVRAYYAKLEVDTATATKEREANRERRADDRRVKDERRKAEADKMRDELKALADTYERPATFWQPAINADEAMSHAKDVMRRRKPTFFDELDALEGRDPEESLLPDWYFDTPQNPTENPHFGEAKRFLNTAEQFPSAVIEVPVHVISTVREWQVEKISA